MAAEEFPESLAFLIAFWVNSFLHGMYLILFLQWLFLPRKGQSIYFTAVCWFGFVASNIDFGVNLYLLIQGFWFSLPHGGPDAFLGNLAQWPVIFREFVYQILVSVCDLFMVYRVWRIWNGNWYITSLPALLLVFETAFGLMAPTTIALGQFSKLITAVNAFLGFNTALQVVITVLICVRLLNPKTMQYLPGSQRARRVQLVRCIVESGLIVTIALIIDLALFVQKINFHWVWNISLTQLYAITTVLIIIRMDKVTSNNPTTAHSSGGAYPSQSGYSNATTHIQSTVDYSQRLPKAMEVSFDSHQSKMDDKPMGVRSPHGRGADDIEMAPFGGQGGAGGRGTQGVSVHVVKQMYSRP